MASVREQYRRTLREGDPSAGFPLFEAMLWDKTLARWLEEGMPKGMPHGEMWEYLGVDVGGGAWITPNGPGCPRPKRHGAGIIRDEKGYDEILPFLYGEDRFPNEEHLEALACRQENGETALTLVLDGAFWHPRTLLGIEPHLFAFYENPALMKRIIERHTAYNVGIIERFCKYCIPERAIFAEDMSYNHGPMISRDLFEEFIAPHYRAVAPLLEKHDIMAFFDSDGNIEPLIPWFKDVGFDGSAPLERQAGVDVNRIRRNYPTFRMFGGFDKMVMPLGEEAMRREFERLKPAVLAGYYIPAVDHQTPPSVSLENYKLFVRLFREFSDEVAREARSRKQKKEAKV